MRFPISVFLFVIILCLSGCVNNNAVRIGDDEVGVVVNLLTGELEEPLTPGTYTLDPLAQAVQIYSTAPQIYVFLSTMSPFEGDNDDAIESRTQEGQQVAVEASIAYQIDVSKVNTLHVRWGEQYADHFIRPSVRSVAREMVAQYRADELYYSPGVEKLEAEVEEALEGRLSEEGLILIDFYINKLWFSEMFMEMQNQIATPEPRLSTPHPIISTLETEAIVTAAAQQVIESTQAAEISASAIAYMPTQTAIAGTRQAEIVAFQTANPDVLVIVEPWQIAVVEDKTTGEVMDVVGPGQYYLNPATQRATLYTNAQVELTVFGEPAPDNPRPQVEVLTADGEPVLIDITILFRIDLSKIEQIHANWKDRYPEAFISEFLDPTLREVTAEVVAQYREEDLYGERRIEVSEAIKQAMMIRLSEQGFMMSDLLVRDIKFTEAFIATIESQIVATQSAMLTATAEARK